MHITGRLVTFAIVTGSAKIGYVGTNFTLSHNNMLRYWNYLHSITYIIYKANYMSDTCRKYSHSLIVSKNYEPWKLEKLGKFYVPTCPITVKKVGYNIMVFPVAY